MVAALHDLEAQAKAEKAAIADIEAQAALPIRLPSPADLERMAYDLDVRLGEDPTPAREVPRRVFKDGKIVLHPMQDRDYLAKAELVPLALLLEAEKGNRRSRVTEPAVSSGGSGGVLVEIPQTRIPFAHRIVIDRRTTA